MKKTLILAASILFALTAYAQTEIVVWHAYRGGEKTAFEKVVNQYNASQNKIKVSPLAVPYDAFADKITAAVPRGKGPDVFIYAQDRLGGWVTAGNTIEPIDFYLDKNLTSRFIPSTMQAMTYRKTIYGLPLNYKVMTMIYNKALVKTPPKTTAELVKVAKANTNAGAGRFGLVYWYSNWYYHAPLFNAFGGGVFDAAGKPVVNSAANVKSIDLMMKWAGTEKILPAEPSTALITSLFNEGKAAIVFSGPWFLEEVSPKIQWGLAVLPTVSEAGGKPMKPWMTVEGVYIAAPSKKKDQAFEFAKYLTDVPATKILALEGSQTPANKNVYNDAQVAANSTLKAFRAQVDNAVPMPNVPEMTLMWSPVTTAMNAIVQKASSPKAALDKAQKDIVEGIGKLKK
ncbi:MAG TPA: extracellular solute-binding protein [Thermoanaerobaculia bacterium]|jgi:arabinogalactan oligomer/maltooligosaccharide transport system substrate-binding protein